MKHCIDCLNRTIEFHIHDTGSGIQILICGGDKPHIGAVAVVDTLGQLYLHEFHGHREGCIAKKWAEWLWKERKQPAVISVGIHYHQPTASDISEILQAVDKTMEELLCIRK